MTTSLLSNWNVAKTATCLLTCAVLGGGGVAVWGLKNRHQSASMADERRTAALREHFLAQNGFMKSELITWKLCYDRALGRNFVELAVRQPLQWHAASFLIRVEARTERAYIGERSAEPRLFSQEVLIAGLEPGTVERKYFYFPTPVRLEAASWSGQVHDLFTTETDLTVEPRIVPASVQVSVFEEKVLCQDADHVWGSDAIASTQDFGARQEKAQSRETGL